MPNSLRQPNSVLTVYRSPQRFLDECAGFLCCREAENNLLLGIAAELCGPAPSYPESFLARVGGVETEAVCLLTPPHRLQLSADCSAAALELLVQELAQRFPELSGVFGPAVPAALFAEFWRAALGRQVRLSTPEYVYRLSTVRDAGVAPGACRRATAADAALVLQWAAAFAQETGQRFDPARDGGRVRQRIRQGQFFLWEDGAPVAVARASGDTPNGVRIGQVFTLPGRRGQGYATSLVAAVSGAMLRAGRRFCFLFADSRDVAANRVYCRVGYEPLCVYSEYSFE